MIYVGSIYLLGYIREIFSAYHFLLDFSPLLIMIVGSVIFGIFNDAIRSHIEENLLIFLSLMVSVAVILVFFNSDGVSKAEWYKQDILASFAGFFGGILTPVGVFIAVAESVRKRKLEEADLLAAEFIQQVEDIESELDSSTKDLYSLLKKYRELDKDRLNNHDIKQVGIEYGLKVFSKRHNNNLRKQRVDDVIVVINNRLPRWKKYKTQNFVKLELAMKSVKDKGDAVFRILSMIDEQVIEDIEKRKKQSALINL